MRTLSVKQVKKNVEPPPVTKIVGDCEKCGAKDQMTETTWSTGGVDNKTDCKECGYYHSRLWLHGK